MCISEVCNELQKDHVRARMIKLISPLYAGRQIGFLEHLSPSVKNVSFGQYLKNIYYDGGKHAWPKIRSNIRWA